MNADPLARVYRWIEYAAFGPALERRRQAFLDQAAQARRLLILGEGDGRFLRLLLESGQPNHVDVIESSAAMISQAKSRLSPAQLSHVRFHHADARSFPYGRYDAAVTNFFLDCFPEEDARRLIANVAAALASGGAWIVAEFAQPERGWRRLHAGIWLGVMYRFFRWTTGLRVSKLPSYEDLLRNAGLVLERQESVRGGLIVSQLWKKL